MNLCEKYSHFFSEAAQSKGNEIVSNRGVTLCDSRQLSVTAEIDADIFTEVQLVIEGSTLFFECECNDYKNTIPCPHIWATLVTCDNFEDLTKATKRSVKKDPQLRSGDVVVDKPIKKNQQPAKKKSKQKTIPTYDPWGLEKTEKQTRTGLTNSTKKQQTEVETNLANYDPWGFSTEADLTNSSEKQQNKEEIDLQDLMKRPSNKEGLDLTDSIEEERTGLADRDYQLQFDESYNQFDEIAEQRPTFTVNYIITINACDENSLLISSFWKQQRNDGTWTQLQPFHYNKDDIQPTVLDERILGILTSNKQNTTNDHTTAINADLAKVILPELARSRQLYWMAMPTSTTMQSLTADSALYDLTVDIKQLDEKNYTVSPTFSNAYATFPLSEALLVFSNGLIITQTVIAFADLHNALPLLTDYRYEASKQCLPYVADALLRSLLEQSTLRPASIPPSLEYKAVESVITPHLYFQTAKFRFRGKEQLQAELTFDYMGTRILPGDTAQCFTDPKTRAMCMRDPNAEEQTIERMHQLGFRYVPTPVKEDVGWKLDPAKLDEIAPVLLEERWQLVAHGKEYRRPQDKQVRVTSNQDWFEVHASVDYDGETVPLPELMAARKKGNSCVQLGDGSYGVLPLDWLINYTVLTELGVEHDDCYQFKRTQALIVDELLNHKETTTTPDFDTTVECVRGAASNMQPMTAPLSFKGKLRPYQQQGLGWMLYLNTINLNGCLADDMGLGKTVQVLALLESRRLVNPGKPTLIVLPKSLIFNWHNEAAKFTPAMSVTIHTGQSRDKSCKTLQNYNLVLTTYGTLTRDIETLSKISFDYCILDESQAIKNSGTTTFKAVKLINADYRLTMTGTPIENSLNDLFSQLEFLNPGLLGSSYKDASRFNKDQLGQLGQSISPLILRRTKEKVATDLPPKTEQILYCELDEWERDKYDELKTYYREQLKDPESSKVDALEALLRLRQACCHAGLINDKFATAPSSKTNLVVDHITNIIAEGHKVLVFSQFTSYLKIVQDELHAKEISTVYLDGQTKDRGAMVEQFQSSEKALAFMISLKAGGTGLNLTTAEYVFLLDPWWNPAIEAQAIDRAYRIGQQNHVIAYRVITKDTVEEKVMNLQNQKRAIADQIVNENNQTPIQLTPQLLDNLLS